MGCGVRDHGAEAADDAVDDELPRCVHGDTKDEALLGIEGGGGAKRKRGGVVFFVENKCRGAGVMRKRATGCNRVWRTQVVCQAVLRL